MRGWLATAVLVGTCFATSAGAHEDKRTDKCGCHHQYGLRHCHPKKKTNSCEALVQQKPRPKAASKVRRPKATKPAKPPKTSSSAGDEPGAYP